MSNDIYIKVTENIREEILDVNDMQPMSLFDFNRLNDKEVNLFDGAKVLNIYFTSGSPLHNSDNFDKIWNYIVAFFRSYKDKYRSYLFEMSSYDIKNRIRSYKGLYYKKGIEYLCQKEYIVKEPYSIIGALVNINNNNSEFSIGRDFWHSFIYVSNAKIIQAEELLDEVVNHYRVANDKIDYTKVIANLLGESVQICRLVSDHRLYYKFQIFCTSNDLESIMDNVRQILEENEFPYTMIEDPAWDPWYFNKK